MTSHSQAASAKSWSDLPLELLIAIGKRLDSRIDLSLFRAVCKNWRSSLNPGRKPALLSPFLPCTISQPTLPFNDRPQESLLLVARTVLLVKPLQSSYHVSYFPYQISYDPSQWILTVEEVVPGKLRILYPLSSNYVKHLPSNFPKHLNLLEYRISEISKSYCLKHANDGNDVPDVRKVVLCSSCTAIVLYGKGSIVGVRLKKGKWSYVRHSLSTSFCDVINVKGSIYGVDYYGDLWIIDYKTMKVIKNVNVNRISHISNHHHKNLVESNGEFYLVVSYLEGWPSTKIFIPIYKLDKLKHEWVEETMRLEALFLSVYGCFFVQNVGTGYVFFAKRYIDSLGDGHKVTSISSEGSSVDLQIGVVFDRTTNDSNNNNNVKAFVPSDSKVTNWEWIADMLWPPPTWFWTDAYSSSGEDEDIEELVFSNQEVSVIHSKEVQPPSFAIPSSSVAAVNSKLGLITKTNGISMHSVIAEDSHALRVQNLNPCSSTTIFGGVNIKSNLVPTLQNIWTKYGNVLKECTIRNGDLIARALESLATTALILKSSSGQTLEKVQADYISSALSDLQQMKLDVNWLVPFVENALAVNKSKSLINSLKDYNKVKALAQELKLKVLDELAKLDEVEEDMNFVFDKIPVLDAVDLDLSLGEGLC